MKSFKDYLTEQEEIETKELLLSEGIIDGAASLLGISTAVLVISWGGALVVKGFMSLGSKSSSGISRLWRKLFNNKKASPNEVKEVIYDIRKEPIVKQQIQKSKSERERFAEKLGKTFEAIESKDVNRAVKELKESGLSKNPEVNRVLINEIVGVFGEPPIHYGNTGNDCYLFVKGLLGIRVAQTTAAVVKESLKKDGHELVKEIDNNEDEDDS